MAGEITFFELGVGDPDRARAFYGGLFGWVFEDGAREGDADPGSGYAIRTDAAPGGVHGGDPGARPYVFFRVDAMDAALDRVRELGGRVDETELGGDEASVARFGRFRICEDDQGSPFGLHEPPQAGEAPPAA
ncbi:VOC family protein [Streptomyces sanyensis]|uniref:VOC family protein n=1 Tax=Streptomyces sanyensis TaxID=568869 RepID=UPI003D76EFC6